MSRDIDKGRIDKGRIDKGRIDEGRIEKGRARDAKASVQDAIGKLIGDTDAAHSTAQEVAAQEITAQKVDDVEKKARRSRTKPFSTSSGEPDPESRSDAKHAGQKAGKA